jgi:hypothetical protein
MRGREVRVGDDKSEPQFSEQERREARARIVAGRERVRSVRASAPGDLYALGVAVRGLVEEPALPAKLAYPNQRAMLDAELQGILADSVLRAVLYVRLIDEGGLPKPARCGPDDLVISVPRVPDGWLSQQTFRRCSFDDLQRALDHLLKQKAPPPEPPKPAPAPPPQLASPPPTTPRPAAAPVALPPPGLLAPAPPAVAPVRPREAIPVPAAVVPRDAPAVVAPSRFPWRYAGLVALLVAAALIVRRCVG